jgi:hypothetical protein
MLHSPFHKILCVATLAILISGCGGDKRFDFDTEEARLDQSATWRAEYLQTAIRNLSQIEQYAGGEMRQQIVDRLNQWSKNQKKPTAWQRNTLLDQLPESLAKGSKVQELDQIKYDQLDGYYLEQSVWMRDLSAWTRGKSIDTLSRSTAMFDWIVRNIQLAPQYPDMIGPIPQYPWEIILAGRGTAIDRAWVFVLMARQQGIDAVILSFADEKNGGQLRPWTIGVLEQGELYLFDPTLGLPIPAPDGIKKNDQGQLVIRPATLREMQNDPAVLESLQLDAKQKYPVTAKSLKNIVAFAVASDESLSARMTLLETKLTGKNKLKITTDPKKLLAQIVPKTGVASGRLWIYPFEVDHRRANLDAKQQEKVRLRMLPFNVGKGTPLWKGRAYYIKGILDGELSATHFLQLARPSDRILSEKANAASEIKDPKKAKEAAEFCKAFEQAKTDAGYWLGLVMYARGDVRSAKDYFFKRTLIGQPESGWTQGAIYNLARSLELLGQYELSAQVLRAAPKTANWYGEQLRANWLDPQPEVQPKTETSQKSKTPPEKTAKPKTNAQ